MRYGQTDAKALRDAGTDVSAFDMSEAQTQQHMQRAIYNGRWTQVASALAELEAAQVEAEVVLGLDIKAEVDKLASLTRALSIGIDNYLRYMTASMAEIGPEKRIAVDSLVFDDPEQDYFASQVNDAVANIGTVARPHLITK